MSEELQQACRVANLLAHWLKEVQFGDTGGMEYYNYCPVCQNNGWHDPGCELKLALDEYDKIKGVLEQGASG